MLYIGIAVLVVLFAVLYFMKRSGDYNTEGEIAKNNAERIISRYK